MKATIITAPERPEYHNSKIFLAGSIDMGAAVDWQARVIEEMSEVEVGIYNPRRANFDKNMVQDASNPDFVEQVEWELDALDAADVIMVYFDAKGQAPITLLELGLHARAGRVIVCCPEGYWRRGNVEIVCARYAIPFVDTLDDMIALAKQKLELKGRSTIPLEIENDTLLALALAAHGRDLTLNQQVEFLLREAINRKNLTD